MLAFFIAFTVVLLVGGQLLMGHYVFRLLRNERKLHAIIDNQNQQMQGLLRDYGALRQRQEELARALQGLRREFDLREAYGDRSGPYAEAIELAREGATVRELVINLGLDETEAALIVNNYGPEPSRDAA